jgi:hypothetical protein
MSSGDRIRAQATVSSPNFAVFLATRFAIEELLALVMRLTSYPRCSFRD